MSKLTKAIIVGVTIFVVGVCACLGLVKKHGLTMDENTIQELYLKVAARGYLSQSSVLAYPAYNSNVGKKDKLKDEEILYIAYTQIEEKDFAQIYNETNFKNIIGDNYNLYSFYEDNVGEYMLMVSKEQLLNKAKDILGSDIEVTNYDVYFSNNVFYKDGYYYRVKDVPMTGANIYRDWGSDYYESEFETCGYTLYDKYIATNDKVEIYTYYINAHERVMKGRKYASRTSNLDEYQFVDFSDEEYEMLENKQWSKELKEKAGYYKHTFKKDVNGNYYWDSAELL